MTIEEKQIALVLENWARATREDRKEDILSAHADDVVIFDVLPPMRYDGAKAYRKSWKDWQPSFEIPSFFEIQSLKIFAGKTHAFCHGIIRCGGKLQDGETVEDFVRATFCLIREDTDWKISHQHISMPLNRE